MRKDFQMKIIGYVLIKNNEPGPDSEKPFVGVDYSSGGYLWATSHISSARIFPDEVQAQQVIDLWKDQPTYGFTDLKIVPLYLGPIS